MRPALTLLLPALTGRVAGLRLPALERLYARGSRVPHEHRDGHALFGHWFSIANRPWPYAALLREAETVDGRQDAWVRADPAWVRPDIAGAQLMGVGTLGLDDAEAASLRATLAPLFGDFGWRLDATHPEHWYLRLPAGAPLPQLVPPWEALGCDLRSVMPEGPEAARWRRLLNESQMLLHAHPVNHARAAARKPPANSVWFWGAGRWPARVSSTLSMVATTDPVLRALSLAAGVRVSNALGPTGEGASLVDLRALREPSELERDWIAPAWRALRSGRIGVLQAFAPDGSGTVCSRAAAFAVWRRRRPLP